VTLEPVFAGGDKLADCLAHTRLLFIATLVPWHVSTTMKFPVECNTRPRLSEFIWHKWRFTRGYSQRKQSEGRRRPRNL